MNDPKARYVVLGHVKSGSTGGAAALRFPITRAPLSPISSVIKYPLFLLPSSSVS